MLMQLLQLEGVTPTDHTVLSTVPCHAVCEELEAEAAAEEAAARQ
jgi:hypothetical protein